VLAFAREAADFDDGAMRNANGRFAQAVPRRAPPKPYRNVGRARRTPRLAGLRQSTRTIPPGN